jgi:hypothetical protein
MLNHKNPAKKVKSTAGENINGNDDTNDSNASIVVVVVASDIS